MHMKYHQRSITLMGCIDQLNRTHTHQRNLNHIYTHACPCENTKLNSQNTNHDISSHRDGYQSAPAHTSSIRKYPHTLSYTSNIDIKYKNSGKNNSNHPHHSHNHHHTNTNSHICVLRTEQNKKLSQLHKNSYHAQLKSKTRCMLQENTRFIEKLVNVKSDLQDLYSNQQGNANMASYRQLLGNIGNGYQGNNNEGNGFVCSSAVNRNKLIKKIAQQNKSIHKRLETAMSKSSYSQEKLKKWNKVNPNLTLTYHSTQKYTSSKTNSNQQHLMRRTMAELQREGYEDDRVYNKTGDMLTKNKRSIKKHYDNIDQLIQNDRLNTETEKSEVSIEILKSASQSKYASKYKFRIKNQDNQGHRIKTQTPDRKGLYCLQSKNQITQLFQNSINYVQNNGYLSSSDKSKSRPSIQSKIMINQTTPVDKVVSRLHTEGNNYSPSSASRWKQNEPDQQHEPQSIKKMRRAAMIHFRKIQKMKATQSKVWQIPHKNTIQNLKDSKKMQDSKKLKESRKIYDISERVEDPEKSSPDKNILLTGIY